MDRQKKCNEKRLLNYSDMLMKFHRTTNVLILQEHVFRFKYK